MSESETGRVRGRCVWWLSGQCKGGLTCTCVPWPRRDSDEYQAADRPPAGTGEVPADGR
jgi:hypothetical protein